MFTSRYIEKNWAVGKLTVKIREQSFESLGFIYAAPAKASKKPVDTTTMLKHTNYLSQL